MLTRRYKFPKLALELIGYLITSIIIASFSFAFLFHMTISFVEKLIEKELFNASILSNPKFTYQLSVLCLFASIPIFFTFFLLFLGEKISYILAITTGIRILKSGDLSFQLEIRGNDELSDLADTINSFSRALQNHRQNEELLKKEKEALIRSLSHDIRTPLTVLISYANFIKDRKDQDEEKLMHQIQIIQNKAQQIQELTHLLLNSDSTSTSSAPSLLDGRLMFEQFIDEFVDALEDAGFKLQVDKLGLTDFKTNLSTQDISRIFDNLYSNIIKYADPHHTVCLKIFILNHALILTQTNVVKNKKASSLESHGIGLKNIQQIAATYQGDMHYELTQKLYKIEIKLLF